MFICVNNYDFNKHTIGMKLRKYNLGNSTWDIANVHMLGMRLKLQCFHVKKFALNHLYLRHYFSPTINTSEYWVF